MKVGLAKGFTPIPEGEQSLKIISAEVTPKGKPSQLELKYQASNGSTKEQIYNWSKDIELYLTTLTVRAALGDMEDFDTDQVDELVGKFIKVNIEHSYVDSKNNPGEIITYSNIKKIIGPGEPWEDEEPVKESKPSKPSKTTKPKPKSKPVEVVDDELEDELDDLLEETDLEDMIDDEDDIVL